MKSEFVGEPRRLREESGSVLERALLDAGVSYRPAAQTRARALTALGLAGSTAILSGSASAATVSSGAKLAFSKLVAAVSLAGAVAAAPVGYNAWQRQQASASALVDLRSRDTAALPALATAPAPAEPAAAATPMVGREGSGSRLARSPRLDGRAALGRASLTRELTVLDAARAALAAGRTSAALSLLSAYSRDFPHGRLEIEAEVLRIDALASSGRGAAARKRAAAFVRRYPDSVFAERVRGFLDS